MENKSAQVNRIVQCAESLESGNINIVLVLQFRTHENIVLSKIARVIFSSNAPFSPFEQLPASIRVIACVII